MPKPPRIILGSTALAALLLAGCQAGWLGADPERSEAMARTAAGASTVTEPGAASAPATALKPRVVPGALQRALADPARLAADRVQDERLRTVELLRFFRIEPGQQVAELYSGGGFWVEALSFAVGPQGRVLAHNSPASAEARGADLEGRFAGGRLANVDQLLIDNHALDLAPASLDRVLLMHAYHEAYHVDRTGAWTPMDGPRLMGQVFAALRPGGVLGVVDYVADPALPAGEAAFLGRIDPARLIADAEAAGFILESRSELLRNPSDNRRSAIHGPGIRADADQVVLRFRKPR
ncbi:MAG: class I SAM-dependent methyltransferase [Chromatiales bacterium]|nr:class I SAM-dependent methyltransferase [Chromatiales bacterium]